MWRYGLSGGQPRSSSGIPLSLTEQDFIISSAIETQGRVDGRVLTLHRNIQYAFNAFGTVQVSVGSTIAIAAVTAELTRPSPDRPTEGSISFNVELSKLCSAFFEPQVAEVQNLELSSQLERFIKEADAIDVETLCVVAGEKVWAVKCDVKVVSDDGNVLDACCLAAMAALRHFRLPHVAVLGKNEVRILSIYEREPIPLNVHRIPVPVTFALLPVAAENGDERENIYVLVDPTQSEEMVCAGAFTVVVTASTGNKASESAEILQEICGLHLKNGGGRGTSAGASLSRADIQKCIHLASMIAKDLTEQLAKEVDQDIEQRKNKILETRGLGPALESQT